MSFQFGVTQKGQPSSLINRCDEVRKKIIPKTSYPWQIMLMSPFWSLSGKKKKASGWEWGVVILRLNINMNGNLASLCWLWVKKCLQVYGRLYLATVSKVEANAFKFWLLSSWTKWLIFHHFFFHLHPFLCSFLSVVFTYVFSQVSQI